VAYPVSDLERAFAGLVLRPSILDERHVSRKSDDGGAHCWLLDTDKGSYKTLAFFRRCVNIYLLIDRSIIAPVRLFLFWKKVGYLL
jgi:hypothetical protein